MGKDYYSLVLNALQAAPNSTVKGIAQRANVSNSTAREYLESMVMTGRATRNFYMEPRKGTLVYVSRYTLVTREGQGR